MTFVGDTHNNSVYKSVVNDLENDPADKYNKNISKYARCNKLSRKCKKKGLIHGMENLY